MERESVAKVLILNQEREALILTTGEYKEHPEKAHKPDFPGGLVDLGESEHTAAIREVYEETGIVLDPKHVSLAYAETKFYGDENKSVSKLLYLVSLVVIPEVRLSWEHEAYEWVDFDTLLETHELRPFYKSAVEYINSNQLI